MSSQLHITTPRTRRSDVATCGGVTDGLGGPRGPRGMAHGGSAGVCLDWLSFGSQAGPDMADAFSSLEGVLVPLDNDYKTFNYNRIQSPRRSRFA